MKNTTVALIVAGIMKIIKSNNMTTANAVFFEGMAIPMAIRATASGVNMAELRSDVENMPADPRIYSPLDTCLCQEDNSIWYVDTNMMWRFFAQV